MADAHGSGPCGSNTMRVQVSFPARMKDIASAVSFFARISRVRRWRRQDACLHARLAETAYDEQREREM